MTRSAMPARTGFQRGLFRVGCTRLLSSTMATRRSKSIQMEVPVKPVWPMLCGESRRARAAPGVRRVPAQRASGAGDEVLAGGEGLDDGTSERGERVGPRRSPLRLRSSDVPTFRRSPPSSAIPQTPADPPPSRKARRDRRRRPSPRRFRRAPHPEGLVRATGPSRSVRCGKPRPAAVDSATRLDPGGQRSAAPAASRCADGRRSPRLG